MQVSFELCDNDVFFIREYRRLRPHLRRNYMFEVKQNSPEIYDQVRALALSVSPQRCAELDLLVREGVYLDNNRENGWCDILAEHSDIVSWSAYQTMLGALD